MLLFSRIFNFDPDRLKDNEHRLNQRYVPGPAFPLQARLQVAGHDEPAKVLNLSGNGIGLLTGRHDSLVEGLSTRVQLTLAGHRLEIPARLVHVAPNDRGLYCGLGFNFGDFLLQKSFLQLLQPVAIGQSLLPVAADRVIQNEPQFLKQIYRGESNSVLTVWLAMTVGTPLHSFEFRMHDYFCRAIVGTGVLDAYTLESAESHKAKLTNPVFDSTGGLHDEICQLFRWIVPNLSKDIPDDVRALLQNYAA